MPTLEFDGGIAAPTDPLKILHSPRRGEHDYAYRGAFLGLGGRAASHIPAQHLVEFCAQRLAIGAKKPLDTNQNDERWLLQGERPIQTKGLIAAGSVGNPAPLRLSPGFDEITDKVEQTISVEAEISVEQQDGACWMGAKPSIGQSARFTTFANARWTYGKRQFSVSSSSLNCAEQPVAACDSTSQAVIKPFA